MIAPNFLSFCLLQFSELKLLISHNTGSLLYPVGMNSGQLVYVFLSFGGRKCLLCFGGRKCLFSTWTTKYFSQKTVMGEITGMEALLFPLPVIH